MKKIITILGLLILISSCVRNIEVDTIDNDTIDNDKINNISTEVLEKSNLGGGNGIPEGKNNSRK